MAPQENAQQLHPLFLRTVADVPVRAELFQYAVRGGRRDLEVRYVISRDSRGVVYLGICTAPAPFEEPTPPLAVVLVWDVTNKQFRLRVRGEDEQVQNINGGVFPAEGHIPVNLDCNIRPSSHLGYIVYGIEGQPGLVYSPALEIAMIYKTVSSEITREYVIQSVVRGEPSLEVFAMH